MSFIRNWNDTKKVGKDYNLYVCIECGMITKVDLWEEVGVLWINVHNKIETSPNVDDGSGWPDTSP